MLLGSLTITFLCSSICRDEYCIYFNNAYPSLGTLIPTRYQAPTQLYTITAAYTNTSPLPRRLWNTWRIFCTFERVPISFSGLVFRDGNQNLGRQRLAKQYGIRLELRKVLIFFSLFFLSSKVRSIDTFNTSYISFSKKLHNEIGKNL